MNKPKNEFLSLKEASELSGYTPDYLGQLIRSGKLSGKQIFQQTAWVTTEKDLRAFLESKRNGSKSSETPDGRWAQVLLRIRRAQLPDLTTLVLSVVAIISALVLFLLFYIFVSSLERQMDQRALEQSERRHTL